MRPYTGTFDLGFVRNDALHAELWAQKVSLQLGVLQLRCLQAQTMQVDLRGSTLNMVVTTRLEDNEN